MKYSSDKIPAIDLPRNYAKWHFWQHLNSTAHSSRSATEYFCLKQPFWQRAKMPLFLSSGQPNQSFKLYKYLLPGSHSSKTVTFIIAMCGCTWLFYKNVWSYWTLNNFPFRKLLFFKKTPLVILFLELHHACSSLSSNLTRQCLIFRVVPKVHKEKLSNEKLQYVRSSSKWNMSSEK